MSTRIVTSVALFTFSCVVPCIAAPLQSPANPALLASFGKIGMTFEETGDTSRSSAFTSRGAGYRVAITAAGAAIDVSRPADKNRSLLQMGFAGANSNPSIEGLELDASHANYLIGRDPAAWRTGVLLYGRVLCHNLYPGIDVAYYGNQRQLEYDLIVAPGVDPSAIQLSLQGAKHLTIDSDGGLLIQMAVRDVLLHAPKVFQEIDGEKRPIAARYVLKGRTRAGFEIGNYDRGQSLVIDPVLSYSTYTGGTGDDVAFAVATDGAGNAYIAGATTSIDFPGTAAGFQKNKRGGNFDAFVAKLNPAGTGLIYSTYIGGTGDDEAFGIAVDSAGNAYVAGYTNSTDFPVTAGSLQTTSAGSDDAFILKLNAAGSGLSYSTYLGGAGSDAAYSIAVDSSGNAYVAGSTASANFNTTIGAYQRTYGLAKDAFVSKLNATGSQLLYSTYLGGSAEEVAYGIAVDGTGTAFVTGYTQSLNFPTTVGAVQSAFGGAYDAFVTALNPAGSALVYSTYIGGSGDDYGYAIAVDAASDAVVAGYTGSGNFPHTVGVLQAAKAAGYDAFVTKLNPTGTSLTFSTFLGGGGDDFALSLALDPAGAIYVAGDTASTDFPLSADAAQGLSTGADFTSFLSILTPAGAALTYSTFLGGGVHETAYGLALTPSGQILLAGYTASKDFPVTAGVLQGSNGGSEDAFVARFAGSGCSYALSQPSATATAAGGTGSVNLIAGAGCAWSVSGNSTWATITSPLSGTGNTTVNYSIAANTGAARSAILTIAGQPFTINQAGGSALPPTADSVSPNTGSGTSQSFTFKYSSPNGFAFLKYGYALFNKSLNGIGACWLSYEPAGNAFFLINDNGVGTIGPLGTDSSATLQNGQCTLTRAGTSATGSGNTVTVIAALTFNNSFAATHTIFMAAGDLSNQNSNWQNRGTWTVPAANSGPPTADSVTPNAGSSTAQSFTFKYSSGNGYNYLSDVYTVFNVGLNGTAACFPLYDKASNSFYLFNDAGTAITSPLTPGAGGNISNSQCTLNGTGSSVSGSGNTLTMTLNLTFASSFVGAKTIFMYASDAGGQNSGWQSRGTWTVPGASVPPPTADSVTPNSGGGASQSFTFKYSSGNGAGYLSDVYMLVNAGLSGASGCLPVYDKGTSSFYLYNDTGSGLLGPLAPGAAGTLSNGQCTLKGTGSSVTSAGNTLTVILSLTFPTSFNGAKTIYMFAADASGQNSGWQNRGAWTVPGATPPTADSVSPNAGGGLNQNFTFKYSSANGYGYLNSMSAVINGSISNAGGCSAYYVAASNALYLYDDSGNTKLGPITPGTAGTLSNSQCSISGPGSSATGSGNTLSLTIAVGFTFSFLGSPNIYGFVTDNGNANSGWQTLGSFSVRLF